MGTLLVASMWYVATLVAQGPVNDDCANAFVPIECQNMAPNPNLGTCSVSAGPPNIGEICDLTIGSAPQHDCVNPTATCEPAPPGTDAYRCQFHADNQRATTDGPDTAGTECEPSGLDVFQSDIWFNFVPPCDGTLIIQNCADADHDSLIQVFSNGMLTCPTCPIADNAQSVICNDDHCDVTGGGSALSFPVSCFSCYAIRVGGSNGTAGRGTSTIDMGMVCNIDGCGFGTFPPLPPSAPHDRPKNRYISLKPNFWPSQIAYRVQKTTFPAGSCWVQSPVQAGQDQYTAKCGPTPVYRIWVEPVIHVGDCAIVPDAEYQVYANGLPPHENPTPFSTRTIPVPTGNNKLWGDTVGVNNGIEWTPPNLFTNVQDVLGILAYITSAVVKPHFTVANLQAISSPDSCLNALVNTADVLISVRAIAGDSYGPPSTGKILDPALCPVCP